MSMPDGRVHCNYCYAELKLKINDLHVSKSFLDIDGNIVYYCKCPFCGNPLYFNKIIRNYL